MHLQGFRRPAPPRHPPSSGLSAIPGTASPLGPHLQCGEAGGPGFSTSAGFLLRQLRSAEAIAGLAAA